MDKPNYQWLDKAKFIRTCQACGHEQEDRDPGWPVKTTLAYDLRKCKRCKSEALDLGSNRHAEGCDCWYCQREAEEEYGNG